MAHQIDRPIGAVRESNGTARREGSGDDVLLRVMNAGCNENFAVEPAEF